MSSENILVGSWGVFVALTWSNNPERPLY